MMIDADGRYFDLLHGWGPSIFERMNLFKDTRRRKPGNCRSFRWRGGSREGGSRMDYPSGYFPAGATYRFPFNRFPSSCLSSHIAKAGCGSC